MRKVVKFGGSSLANAEQFEKVGDIIRSEESRRFVVPSAPGKRFDGDTKVTDLLYSCYDADANGGDFEKVLEEIKKIGIVPVVVLDDAKDAEPLAKALCEGGLPCAEVTFRTEAAEESIRIISEKYPEMLVGAGTVLTTEQVDRAVAAGAKFIVSPGFNPKVVKYCIDRDIPVTPGTQTPSEMEQAIEMGLDVVKFFPAEPAGGLKMIKAVAAPYTMLQFMPTGGINLNNVEEYLEYDRILACGGSWMVKGDLVKAGKFDEIQKMTADAAALVKKIRG